MINLTQHEVILINYLLLFTIAWSSLTSNMSSELREKINEHKWLSHILLIFILFNMIYGYDTSQNPYNIFVSAILVYISYIILVNQKYEVFVLLVTIILVIYLLRINAQYYNKQGELNTENELKEIENYFQYSAVIIAICGFLYYLGDKNKSYLTSLIQKYFQYNI